MIGARVLVTGSHPEPLCDLLEARGAVPLAVPTIAIRPRTGGPLDGALSDADRADWIVVTSPNGAAAVVERLRVLGLPIPRRPRWAAVGAQTRAALETAGVAVAAVPEAGHSAAIPAALGGVAGRRILLLRSALAGDDLPRRLRAQGARVEDVVAYETEEGPEASRSRLRSALEQGVDAAVFTSGSTVRGFVRLAGDPIAGLAGATVVCIGPATARAAREAGLAEVRVAAHPSPAGIVAALGGAEIHA